MDRPVIETPDDFARYQEDAMEAALCNEPAGYCPTNEDLVKVLEKWEGMVALEFESDAATLHLLLIKKDLISEIRRNWPMSGICNLKFSCISHGHELLVLKPF